MRALWVVAAVLVASGALAQPRKPTALESEAASAVALVVQDSCAEAAARLKAVYEDPSFRQFEPPLRSAVLEGSEFCEARLGHLEAAYALSRRAIQEDGATALGWGLHVDLALSLSRTNDALSALTVLSKRSPAILGEVSERTIQTAYASAGLLPHADARRLELLEALDGAKWRPKDPFNESAVMQLDRIRLLLGAGRQTEASAVARGLTDPSALIAMRVDDRFGKVSTEARELDVIAQTRRALVKAVQLASRRPEWLSGPIRIAQLRLRLGENEAALKVLQDALDRRRDFGDSAFEDAADNLRVVQALKAETLFRLGRLNEADGAFAEAAADDADGSQGFDQRLAYASYLIDTDRAALALDLLKDVKTEPLNDNGKAYLAAMRACAYAVLKNRPAMARELAIVKAPTLPEYGALVNALVCAGDLQGAVRLYVERLKDPGRRAEALIALQRYRRVPNHGEEDKLWDDDFAKVKSDPAVLEAVKAAGGRIETYEIYDPGEV